MRVLRLAPLPVYQRPPMLFTPDEKPTLLYLRREYNKVHNTHLTSQQVAEEAGVPLWVYFQAEIGCLVSREDAARILPALSRLIDRLLTIDDVYMSLR